MSCMVCMVWLVGLALNLSKYWSNFPPSGISDSNMASKLGAGDAGGVFFRVKSLGICPDGISTFERFSSLIHCMNIIILVYYDG